MNEFEKMAQKIKNADAILIGAANGFSISEGLHLFADNDAFENLFYDFKQKYGFRCILHGMTHHWLSDKEKWGFWSRLVNHYCNEYTETSVMKNLKEIVGEKDYFIITSNGECHFEMSGFASEKIYEIEGNWLTMQCALPCHDKIYPCSNELKEMSRSERNGSISSKLIPHCPKCGGPMEIHMAGGASFIPDATAQKNLQSFLKQYHNKNILILELGIGPYNQLIKAPLMELVEQEPNAAYITVNLGELFVPAQIRSKSFAVNGHLEDILAKLNETLIIS